MKIVGSIGCIAAVAAMVGAAGLPSAGAPSRSAAAATGASQSRVVPRVVLTVRGTIEALAQDGTRIAWIERGKCGDSLRVLNLSTGRRWTLRKPFGTPCGDVSDRLYPSLAIAGTRVLWAEASSGNSVGYVHVRAADVATGRKWSVDDSLFDYSYSNPGFTAVAGGGMLAFALAPGAYYGDGGVRLRADDRRVVRLPSGGAVAGGATGVVFTSTSSGDCLCSIAPSWSPDGSLIAYRARSGGHAIVRLVTPDGLRTTDVDPTIVGHDERHPTWSPDGHRIALGGNGITLVTADGTQATHIDLGEQLDPVGSGEPISGFEPDWSPDGSAIAFSWPAYNEYSDTSTRTLGLVAASGGVIRRLTDGQEPDWSPDGKKIASARPFGGITVTALNAPLKPHELTRRPDFAPAWSPTGSRIAFVRATRKSGTPRLPVDLRLWSMNANGSDQRPLTRTTLPEYGPTWSPDGSQLAFLRGDGLYVARSDGTHPHRIANADLKEDTTSVTLLGQPNQPTSSITTLAGTPEAIANSNQIIAVLVDSLSGRRIQTFDPATGQALRNFASDTSAPALRAAGRTVIYRRGREIRGLDTTTGRQTTLATAHTTPIGVSVTGTRLAWAENHAGRAVVYTVAVRLPH